MSVRVRLWRPRRGDRRPRPDRSYWWNRALRSLIGLVWLLALVAIVVSAFTEKVHAADLALAAVLAGVAVGYDIVARRIERVRRLVNAGPFIAMSSVWTFSGALDLPVTLAAALAALILAQEEVQSRLGNNPPRQLYRVVFNICVVILSCVAAHLIARDVRAMLGGSRSLTGVAPLLVAAAIVAYALTSLVFISLVLVFASRRFDLRRAVGSLADNLLELATLGLGGLIAVAVTIDAWFVLLAVPAMGLLQRVALVDQLESAATEDSKTGLLNAAAWQHLAERELARGSARQRPAAVMVIDLDHFKRVNDTYGHLTGDAVLRAVADCMAGMLRDRDLVSRFGGEEFVALLSDADAREALRVAERLRARIADVVVTQVGDPPQAVLTEGDPLAGADPSTGAERIKVTVSVGLAAYPEHGETVLALLAKADAALYDAKHAGRNRVRVSARNAN